MQAHAEFANGVRWAICGADPSLSGEVLNLRSTDNGTTWTVSYTGFAMSPHHAGDSITVYLATANVGGVRLHGSVGGFDKIYTTSNEGRTWRLICDEEAGLDPSPRCTAVWTTLSS